MADFRLRERELPPLPPAFLDDFSQLLIACRRADVRLIPSLLSFEFFHPLGAEVRDVTSSGRAALVFGNDGE